MKFGNMMFISGTVKPQLNTYFYRSCISTTEGSLAPINTMAMTTTCVKRLRKEILMLEKNPDEFITLIPSADNMRIWSAMIRAPPDSVYEGFIFDLSIEVGADHPLTPPKMRFLTRIFHPNVHFQTGEICLDILKKEWSPAWSLQSASRAIMALLGEPAADSPLNCDAGNMLRAGDDRAFKSMARMYCVEFAREYVPIKEVDNIKKTAL